jgi:hypothetical protein
METEVRDESCGGACMASRGHMMNVLAQLAGFYVSNCKLEAEKGSNLDAYLYSTGGCFLVAIQSGQGDPSLCPQSSVGWMCGTSCSDARG